MSRLIIFGERPGRNTDPERPLFPHTTTGAAARLINLLGITQERYLNPKFVVRYNAVADQHTSTASPEAREYVQERMTWHVSYDGTPLFLFLGKDTARAGPFYVRRLEFGIPFMSCLLIPHPSGRNRYYNSEANSEFIIRALRKFAGSL